jgi:folate-binding protein YgfZ
VDHSKSHQKQALGAVRIYGVDAVSFLQGQLSNDMTRLSAAQTMLAGLHNPQGRTIAVLRLTASAPEDVLATLPRDLVAPVIARLSKFVLRAKVKLSEAEAQGGVDAERQRALDIEQGIPQVYLATSEAFVAQMLNLDVVGGISFEKGCYTGQEVIARAHYRGRVKRRMQRFRSLSPLALAPGDSGALLDGRTFRVVDAVPLADGRSEFLAVTALAAGDPAESDATASLVAAEPLPLPYSLPD